jgi:hypothetical protein
MWPPAMRRAGAVHAEHPVSLLQSAAAAAIAYLGQSLLRIDATQLILSAQSYLLQHFLSYTRPDFLY